MNDEVQKRRNQTLAIPTGDPATWPLIEPAVDSWRTNDQIVIELEMPGVAAESVDIQVEHDVLRVTGRGAEPDEGERQLAHQEYRIGTYRRVFTLPDDVDRDRVEASMDKGILRITLPIAETARARRIDVKPLNP